MGSGLAVCSAAMLPPHGSRLRQSQVWGIGPGQIGAGGSERLASAACCLCRLRRDLRSLSDLHVADQAAGTCSANIPGLKLENVAATRCRPAAPSGDDRQGKPIGRRVSTASPRFAASSDASAPQWRTACTGSSRRHICRVRLRSFFALPFRCVSPTFCRCPASDGVPRTRTGNRIQRRCASRALGGCGDRSKRVEVGSHDRDAMGCGSVRSRVTGVLTLNGGARIREAGIQGLTEERRLDSVVTEREDWPAVYRSRTQGR